MLPCKLCVSFDHGKAVAVKFLNRGKWPIRTVVIQYQKDEPKQFDLPANEDSIFTFSQIVEQAHDSTEKTD